MRAKIVFSSVFVLPSKTPAGKKGIGIEIEAVRLPPNGGGGGGTVPCSTRRSRFGHSEEKVKQGECIIKGQVHYSE